MNEECFICFNQLQNKISLCASNHFFCVNCYEQMQSHSRQELQCPYCKQQTDIVRRPPRLIQILQNNVAFLYKNELIIKKIHQVDQIVETITIPLNQIWIQKSLTVEEDYILDAFYNSLIEVNGFMMNIIDYQYILTVLYAGRYIIIVLRPSRCHICLLCVSKQYFNKHKDSLENPQTCLSENGEIFEHNWIPAD